MNYIKHFNQWLSLLSIDDRLSTYHVSIYIALFHVWNKNRFPSDIFVYRNEIMQISKVGSTRTYYKCMHQLHDFGYILYAPSKCPIAGSKVRMVDLSDAESDDSNNDSEDEGSSSFSATSTHASHEQNRPISCSKNASSADSGVTPLFINRINNINYKQCERRARAKKDGKIDFSFSELKKNGYEKLKALYDGGISDGAVKSKPIAVQSAGNRLDYLNSFRRNFSIPELEEVKKYFVHQLSGKFVEGISGDRDIALEAEKFYCHYEANGWMLSGRFPMRSWKAACRSWIVKIPYFCKSRSTPVKENPLHYTMDDHYYDKL